MDLGVIRLPGRRLRKSIADLGADLEGGEDINELLIRGSKDSVRKPLHNLLVRYVRIPVSFRAGKLAQQIQGRRHRIADTAGDGILGFDSALPQDAGYSVVMVEPAFTFSDEVSPGSDAMALFV